MKEIRKVLCLKYLNMFSVPLQFLAVFVGYFFIEAISRHSIWEAISFLTERPLVFLYNTFLIFTTTLIVYLFRRRVFWRVILTIFWMGLGIINGVLLSTRVTPFTGPDLHMITDAFEIADRYLPPFFFWVVVVLAVMAVLALILLFIKGPRYKGKFRYKVNIPLIIVGILAFAGTTKLALEKRVLSNYFGNIAFAYEDYGYPYCLATTIFNTGISCPRDYSEEAVEEIIESEDALPETGDSRPNILFLQLESFFDPTLVNYLDLSEDPIPNFRKLMEEYSSGYYKVPSVGAGTANTEFETITGMSMHYFGPGEYPYKGILETETCESAAYVLKDLGYGTHAIHNNEANFYGRRRVFANLGFDTFTSSEYMSEQDDTNPNDWIRDRNLTKYILQAMESTDGPDYVYTISVQGLGDYPEEPVLEDPKITVSGSSTEAQDNKWEYYCNQIYEMDQFAGNLIRAIEERGEPTVVVFYGDHLPTMGLEAEDLKSRYLYNTNYVIWDNIGLPKEDRNIPSYQIMADVLERLDIHSGTVFNYHQQRRQTRNYLSDLELLQYDILYGDQYVYNGNPPVTEGHMVMGVRDVTLKNVVPHLDEGYSLYGENFTQNSKVYVNGEKLKSSFLNNTRIDFSGVELVNGDEIVVRQMGSSNTTFRKSDIYIYQDGNLIRQEGTATDKTISWVPQADEEEE